MGRGGILVRKKILKGLNRLFNSALFKLVLYVGLLAFILSLYGVFDTGDEPIHIIGEQILSILRNEETLSVFLAGILSLGAARLMQIGEAYLEETFKIEDDHHAVVGKYDGHPIPDNRSTEDILDPDGSFLYIRHIDGNHPAVVANHKKKRFSKSQRNKKRLADQYNHGRLLLPTVNVFANVSGESRLAFQDKDELYLLPDYIISNAERLLAAHKSSKINNSATIRLSDVSYGDGKLILHTQRSTYFHMLITNRCMDYAFCEGITVRELYEYGSRISQLNQSKLGNQIGINGLLVSSDGYVLMEKRGYNKTTWKNKFAQSISLALKLKDMDLENISDFDADAAHKNLGSILRKTLRDNFGLTAEDLDLPAEGGLPAANFLGLARDLLEGGKPNLYFYVATKCTGEELLQRMEQAAALADEETAKQRGGVILQDGKLESDYYLVPFDDICIDFNYRLKLDRRKCLRLHRHLRPRSNRWEEMVEKVWHRIGRTFAPIYTKECGEALLVTLAYLEVCRHRIAPLCTEEKEK